MCDFKNLQICDNELENVDFFLNFFSTFSALFAYFIGTNSSRIK